MSKTETTNTTTPPTTPNPFQHFAFAMPNFAAFSEEYAALEAQMYARAKQAIDAWAQLAQDALAYSAQLSAQARKIGLDAARKMGA